MNNFNNISPPSKVWVYQSNRVFSEKEASEIKILADAFVKEWASHGNNLSAAAEIFHNRFLVLGVDETRAGASGCSIDKSVKFIQSLEEKFNCDFFDRMQVAYRDNKEIKTCTLSEFEDLIEDGIVTENTIVFNNLVHTKEDFDTRWEVLLKDSWHNQLIL